MDDDYKPISECGYNADKEVLIIPLPNAVIEPHTVMVEFVNTAIAGSAVLAAGATIAVTVRAVEYLLDFRIETDLLIVDGPLVVVNHSVSRVNYRGQEGTYDHSHPEKGVEGDEDGILAERDG